MTNQLKTMTLDQLVQKIRVCENMEDLQKIRSLALSETAYAELGTREHIMKLINNSANLLTKDQQSNKNMIKIEDHPLYDSGSAERFRIANDRLNDALRNQRK